ncbi:MAG: hypothetical protein ABFS34_17050, partial [Gemmatimonadota bacterium]
MSTQQQWQQIHERLVELAATRAAADFEEAGWLIKADRARVHEHLGFGSLREYLERLFGYGPRQAEERLRVARALVELPQISEALRDGQLCWSAARELSRVAVADTEEVWLAATRGQTARQIEAQVSGRGLGDDPNSPVEPGAKRRRLRFEVSAATWALFREARARVEDDVGESLDDDALIASVARYVLGGPTDVGRSSYQIAVTVCASCERGFVQGKGELVEVDRSMLECANCDAQHLGRVDGSDSATRATQAIRPKTRRQVLRRDHGRC